MSAGADDGRAMNAANAGGRDSPMAAVLAESLRMDAIRLHRGADALHAKAQCGGGPLFCRSWRRPGMRPVEVRFTWPGVLMEVDVTSGEIIREASAATMWQTMPVAAQFMAGVQQSKPLLIASFQPPQGQALRASICIRGVVRVHAVKGVELLAESEPGQPYTLRAGFHSLSAQDLAPRIH